MIENHVLVTEKKKKNLRNADDLPGQMAGHLAGHLAGHTAGHLVAGHIWPAIWPGRWPAFLRVGVVFFNYDVF